MPPDWSGGTAEREWEAFSSLSNIQSLPAALFPPGWKKTLFFSAQSTGYPLAHPDTAKASRQECEERDKRPLLDVRALAVCFITPSPWSNRLPGSRSITRSVSPVWGATCSLGMETCTRLLNTHNSTGKLKAALQRHNTTSKYKWSELCSNRLITLRPSLHTSVLQRPLLWSGWAVSKVSLLTGQEFPHGGSGVFASECRCWAGPDSLCSPQPREQSSGHCHRVSPQNGRLTHSHHHHHHLSKSWLCFFRFDATALSPDLLPSVHSGDRILEVNGVPVCNIPPDEVLAHVDISWKVNEVTGTGSRLKLDRVSFPIDKLCDPGYSQTSAADYWTQPPESWWAPSSERFRQPCWWPWALCSWKTQFDPQTSKFGGRAEPRGGDRWKIKDEHPAESATRTPRNCGTADQTHFVSARFWVCFFTFSRLHFSTASLVFFIRRSSSIDKCPLSPGALSLLSQKRDMVRSESLRVDSGDRTHRIFRPSDLIHGEVIGKGFFGQAVKVLRFLHIPLCSFRYFCLTFILLHPL